MKKHTKEPWEAHGTKTFGLSEIIAPNAEFHEGYLVASVNHMFFENGSKMKRLPREQVEANARLIAAAPDLLEACHKARALLAGSIAEEDQLIVEAALREAIRKA